jgi:inositol 1,4,5-triphosphate receptor type 1
MEPIHEGDIVYLFCRDAKGFIYAQSPCSSYSHVTVYQVPNAEGESKVLKDPALPNIHFASFKVLSENVSQDSNSPLGRGVSNDHGQEFNRSLVYGRKIKVFFCFE